MGDSLRQLLRQTDWSRREADIRNLLADHRNHLRLIVRSNRNDVYTLPWELLTLQDRGTHLATHPRVFVGYTWPDESAENELRARRSVGIRPRRVLLAWSSEGPPPAVSRHVEALVTARDKGGFAFREGEVIANMTLRRLRDRLAEVEHTEPIALHIVCHGLGSVEGHGLACLDADGQRAVISAAPFRDAVGPYADRIALLVLCSCNSGDTAGTAPGLDSLAQTAHRLGIPWVIGSRFPLSKADAVKFSRCFYEYLANASADVEDAFVHARDRLIADSRTGAWFSLQLYVRDNPDSRRGQPDSGLLTTGHGELLATKVSRRRALAFSLASVSLLGLSLAFWLEAPHGTPAPALRLSNIVASRYNDNKVIIHYELRVIDSSYSADISLEIVDVTGQSYRSSIEIDLPDLGQRGPWVVSVDYVRALSQGGLMRVVETGTGELVSNELPFPIESSSASGGLVP